MNELSCVHEFFCLEFIHRFEVTAKVKPVFDRRVQYMCSGAWMYYVISYRIYFLCVSNTVYFFWRFHNCFPNIFFQFLFSLLHYISLSFPVVSFF
jgi:hypothetical protein